MKKLVLIFSLALVTFGCQDKVAKSMGDNATEASEVNEEFLEAVITTAYKDEGCPVMITITENGKETLYEPYGLMDSFMNDGTTLYVKYTLSRIRQTSCLKAQPVIISEAKMR